MALDAAHADTLATLRSGDTAAARFAQYGVAAVIMFGSRYWISDQRKPGFKKKTGGFRAGGAHSARVSGQYHFEAAALRVAQSVPIDDLV